jgi:hypothetical protein
MDTNTERQFFEVCPFIFAVQQKLPDASTTEIALNSPPIAIKIPRRLTARSEIETIFQLIDVAEGRAPHTNHYHGSHLDQMSLAVGGRRRQPSPQLARLAFNGNCH